MEMPTGTGKTVCLLSLITSYQFSKPSAGKLIYCTRTVPEMNHVMEELATVLSYRAEQLRLQEEQEQIQLQRQQQQQQQQGVADVDMEDMTTTAQQRTDAQKSGQDTTEGQQPSRKKPRRVIDASHKRKGPSMGPITDGKGAGGSGVLALCLSSRRNMCIHERVMAESDREAVDAACRGMTATWVLEAARKNPGSMETCEYYDNFQSAGEAMSMPSGVYDLEELKKWGKSRGWCPYYLTVSQSWICW